MEEERVERDLVGERERAGGVERDLIGLADDEVLEPVAGLQRDRIEAGRGLGLAFRRRRRDFDQSGGVRRGRADADPDLPHLGDLGAPRQRQPLGEMGLDPIGHELGGELEPERAGVPIEAAQARSAAASRRRCGRRNRGAGPRESIPMRPRSPRCLWSPTSVPLPLPASAPRAHPSSLSPLWRGRLFFSAKVPRAESPPRASRCSIAILLCVRPEDSPAGRSLWNPDAAGSSGKKASSKLNYIDTRKTAELRRYGEEVVVFQIIIDSSRGAAWRESREILGFRAGRSQARKNPPARTGGRQVQTSERLSRASRDGARGARISAPQYSCAARRATTPRASSGWTRSSAALASVLSPAASADSTCLTKVRMRLTRAPLISARLALRLDAFLCLRRIRHRDCLVTEMKRARPRTAPAQAAPSTVRGRRGQAFNAGISGRRRSSGPSWRGGESWRRNGTGSPSRP